MAKVRILHASINPSYYEDVSAIAKMGFDEAKDFFEKDTIRAGVFNETEYEGPTNKELKFIPDGAEHGDPSDCSLVWMKIEL